MALPMLAMAAPAVGAAAYKFFSGLKQVKDGKNIEKNNKFINYTRPPEVTQALDLAERNYRNGMPGSDILKNRIGSNAATVMTSASEGSSSSGDMLDAITRIGVGTNKALQDLSLQELNFEQNALKGYTNELGNNARYADKEFDYNIAQPYQRKAAAASALIGAGNRNKFSAIDDFAGVATSGITAGLGLPKIPTMGEIHGTPDIAPAGSVGVTQTNTGFSNPSLMGKWIVDPASGAKRWSING